MAGAKHLLTVAAPACVLAAHGETFVSVQDGKQMPLALVANHDDGTVSVLGLEGQRVSVLDRRTIGDAKPGPMHVAVTPDGRRALVMSVSSDGRAVIIQNTAERQLQLLRIDRDEVRDAHSILQFDAAPAAIRSTGR